MRRIIAPVPQERFQIVCAEPYSAAALARLRAAGQVAVLDTCDDRALAEAVRDCDALLVRSEARVTRAVLAQAGRLRVIGRGGVGLDNIDLAAAAERGVTVVHTPYAATDAVADLTVGLMIALLRCIPKVDAMVRGGRHAEARAVCVARELGELTLGIVGLGRIGRSVARRCRDGFGMAVLYNDIIEPGPLPFQAHPVEKGKLYAESDVVSLHVPLTAETRHLIRDETVAVFRRGALLINTARGAVVDGDALARGLRTGAIGGAALDVTEPEPLPPGHSLLASDRVILTPHIGARTVGALERMNAVVEDVIRVLEGGTPHCPAAT